MNTLFPGIVLYGALAAFALPALGQAPAPTPPPPADSSHVSAQEEAGEPRAMTSPDALASPASTSAGSAGPGSTGTPGSTTSGATRTPAARAALAASAGGGGKSAAVDRLELGTATVTGDREQPKVMYIVPWKKSDIGDLSGKPMNSLLDEALAPIDRDEFKREVIYYQAVKADASQNGASKPVRQGEK
ncbi:MAG TPA: hypothetical protein VK437_04990 [Steroidobacteraceae bacterium]|nr:hypothetical protein [Steroidobacteraceae bacterium]